MRPAEGLSQIAWSRQSKVTSFGSYGTLLGTLKLGQFSGSVRLIHTNAERSCADPFIASAYPLSLWACEQISFLSETAENSSPVAIGKR